jgi:hypothetical protein
LLPDGTVTGREQIASGAGTSRAEYGAVLPLIYISYDAGSNGGAGMNRFGEVVLTGR